MFEKPKKRPREEAPKRVNEGMSRRDFLGGMLAAGVMGGATANIIDDLAERVDTAASRQREHAEAQNELLTKESVQTVLDELLDFHKGLVLKEPIELLGIETSRNPVSILLRIAGASHVIEMYTEVKEDAKLHNPKGTYRVLWDYFVQNGIIASKVDAQEV